MEDADGSANEHQASTTVYEGAGEPLYRSEDLLRGVRKQGRRGPRNTIETGGLGDYDECSQSLLRYPWHPFRSAYEFRIARYFTLSKASQGNIDSFFLHTPPSSGECSYSTGRGFIKRLEEMSDIVGKGSWNHSEVDIGGEKISYYYRNPMVVVGSLLAQRAFRESLVYLPVVEHNEFGERMYGHQQKVGFGSTHPDEAGAIRRTGRTRSFLTCIHTPRRKKTSSRRENTNISPILVAESSFDPKTNTGSTPGFLLPGKRLD
ncbi:hypothetical protein DFP73DRAFT_595716 [Morchella snyderi]|nr:hypothetical protein DFP73DRAFT_595716 [Morchella snyderi]